MNDLAAPPSQAAVIRAWLELQTQPRTALEVAAAISLPGNMSVVRHVHRLWRDKFLLRSGRCKRYAFVLARDVVKRPAATSAERERRRRVRNGGRSREQWKAECAARAEAKAAQLQSEKAARRQAAAKERAQREDEREAARAERARPAPKPSAKPAAPRVRALTVVPPRSAPVPRESVEDFQRRGGKVIHLEPCVWSNPLRTAPQQRAA